MSMPKLGCFGKSSKGCGKSGKSGGGSGKGGKLLFVVVVVEVVCDILRVCVEGVAREFDMEGVASVGLPLRSCLLFPHDKHFILTPFFFSFSLSLFINPYPHHLDTLSTSRRLTLF